MARVLLAYIATSFLILPPDEHDPAMAASKPTFDFAGTITGVTGLILVNFAWNQAGVVGWQVSYTYILLTVGFLFFAAFVYIEIHVARHPLVPISMLTKEAVFSLSIVGCGWAAFGIWVFYLWQLILNLRHHSTLSSAAQQISVAFSGLAASMFVGFFMSKVKVAWLMVAAMCFFLTGQILIATTPVSQTYWAQTFVSLVIMPWGMDISFPAGHSFSRMGCRESIRVLPPL